MIKPDHQNPYINSHNHAHSLFLSYTILPDVRICCQQVRVVLIRRRRHLSTRIQFTLRRCQ